MIRFWRVRRLSAVAVREDGFTLIEVMAALSLLAIVTAGLVPLFISGLRASLASKFETQAKNLAQERLELMRNLPFYVVSSSTTPAASCWNDPNRTNPLNSSGLLECDYKDLLDTYYRSSTLAASSTSTGGYVASSGNRSADEVAAGLTTPYYRFVLNPVPNFQNGRFSQVIVSQFLNVSRQVLTPPLTYNTQNSNTDFPPSRLLGVTVFTRWTLASQARKYVTYSQIAEGSTEPTSVTLEAEATAIRIRSGLDISNSTQIEAEAGISRSEGTLAAGPNASTYAQGAYAALVPGERADGRFATASAPPSTSNSGGNSGLFTLNAGSPPFPAVTMADTQYGNNVTAGTVSEQPSVPADSPGTNLSRGSLLKGGGSYDLSYSNGPPEALTGMPALDTTRPVVSAKGTGADNTANGQSYLRSQAASSHFAEAGARLLLQQTQILPTTFAPNGLVQVQIFTTAGNPGASITCKTTGTSTTGTTSSFTAQVKYFSPNSAGAVGGYVTKTFTSGSTEILPAPADVVVNSSPEYRLSNYLRDWSVTTSPTTTFGPGGSSASSTLNGIVKMTTQNTRPSQGAVADDASAISVTLGILSCVAEDKRT